MEAMNKKAKVYLVGAGPGRIDLITVRGLELIKAADCIVYDKLVNTGLLKYACPDAELISVPKRIGTESFKQEQINNLLLEKSRQHKSIVRLKGGDPSIFGRGVDEAGFLSQAGVEIEIVPGITAALGASCYSGIPLTDRNIASEVIFVTGHEAEGKKLTSIDWNLLAKFSGTIVFYMGMENLSENVSRLIDNGKSPDTPAAAVANATLPSQRTVKAALSTIAARCETEKIEAPALIFIGPTARGDIRLEWLNSLPLFGKTLVITRDAQGNAEFAAKLSDRMASVIEMPVTKLKALTDSTEFIKTLSVIHQYDWVIFTSCNGVETFFAALSKLGKDSRVFSSAKIAAIGIRTGDCLSNFGIKADFVPEAFTSSQLAKGLIEFTNLKNKKVLLLRSQIASDDLPQLLEAAGASVHNVPVYTQEKNLCDFKAVSQNKIDWLTFASPFAADCFFEQAGADFVKKTNAKVASIGPVTSKKLAALGMKIDIEASEHTFDGLISAIEEYELALSK